MANLIPEEGRPFSDPNHIDSQIREYIKLKSTMTVMETRSKELRDKIFEYLDAEGEEDTSGSFGIYLDQEVDGIVRLQKTRRTKRVLDESTADAIIEQAGIADDVYEMKRVISEEALMAAFYEEKISEEQLDSMFPVTVTWALNTLKK
jgi:hypothetical protein